MVALFASSPTCAPPSTWCRRSSCSSRRSPRIARTIARSRLGLKPASDLTDDDKRFLLVNSFHAQRARMIEPSPRYSELLRKRDSGNGNALGDVHRRRLPRPAGVVEAGLGGPVLRVGSACGGAGQPRDRDFTEADKTALRSLELDVLRAIVPEYRAAAASRGQVELSASPFYHPILPLLCDTDIYLRTHPQSRMPRQRFRHPEDAQAQLDRAVGETRGDVRLTSDRALAVGRVGLGRDGAAGGKAGFAWMATDELILARSIGVGLTRDGYGHLEQPEMLYRPYVVQHGRRRDRLHVPRPRALGSDRVHLRRRGTRRPPPRTSWAGWSKAAGGIRRGPAAGKPSFRSSSTARTPGSTTRARAGRSFGRCIARSAAIRSFGP